METGSVGRPRSAKNAWACPPASRYIRNVSGDAPSALSDRSNDSHNTGHGSTFGSGRTRSFVAIGRLPPIGIYGGRQPIESPSSRQAFIKCDSSVLGTSEALSRAFEFETGGGPRWTRTTYLRVISTALC